jgi:hypothetical protein
MMSFRAYGRIMVLLPCALTGYDHFCMGIEKLWMPPLSCHVDDTIFDEYFETFLNSRALGIMNVWLHLFDAIKS